MQTFTPAQYLKIDIATNFGLDDTEWQPRIDWFDLNEPNLETLVNQAKTPALFYAGVLAYRNFQRKVPSGYMVSMDATSSGLQILACLTGDLSAAKLCNVVNNQNKRMDAYIAIYNLMLDQIGEESRITRKDVKTAVMTSLYNSRAEPRRVFGEGSLLDLYYDTISNAAPAAWELNEAFLEIWNSDALSHDWIMPDNFHVHIKVMTFVKECCNFMNQPITTYRKVNKPVESSRSLGANTTHSVDGMIVREMTRRCDYDPKRIEYVRRVVESDLNQFSQAKVTTKDNDMVLILWNHYKESGYLSARILDHINIQNVGIVDKNIIIELLDSLPIKPFKIVTIHDCFRCHPNYANDLRKQYILQLSLITKSNLLSYLLSQIIGHKIQIHKANPNLASLVLETEYALS